MLKKLISFMLCALLVLQVPVVAYAETPGASNGRFPIPGTNDPNFKPAGNASTFKDFGFRVTLTTAAPMVEEGIQKLEGQYTKEDIQTQRDKVETIMTHRYWEPGNLGIYYWRGLNSGIKPNYGVATSQPGEGWNISSFRQKMVENPGVNEYANLLAWTCWENPDSPNRPTAFNKELYDILVGNGTQYANGDDWLYDIKQKYYAATGANDEDVLDRMRKVVSNGTGTADNIRNFSWDTTITWGTPQQQVFWSFTGHLTMCIQFAWVADIIGDKTTYEEFKNILYSYYVSGYEASAMPVLEIEACSEISMDGTSNAVNNNAVLMTLPYQLNDEYGTASSPVLYAKWPDGINTTDGIVKHIAGTKVPNSGTVGRLGQGLGYIYTGGVRVNSPDKDRIYFETLKPVDDPAAGVVGYLVAFCYFADNPTTTIIHSGDPAKGTFTWDLTPKGIIDKTPSEEVNESSTIYNLNVSQNGHNSNNYAEWEKWVLSDGKDCNKIRFNIYHVSEALNKDVPATDYTYGQVKATGKKVTEAVDCVADRRLS